VLLASSGGGHFTELEFIADAMGIPAQERHWVVPRSRQTLVRLAGTDQVTFVPQVHSRDAAGALRNLAVAVRLHRRLRPRMVLTAGAAQAVPHLLAAAASGTRITYVESLARLHGPSVTGRIAAALPRTTLLAPHDGWGGRWRYFEDMFAAFRVDSEGSATVESAVVALGAERYPFPRAVRDVRRVLGLDVPVTWQVGTTDIPHDQPNRWLGPDELADAMASSSVVITHGGVGSILTALQAGRLPVVVPRIPEMGERCDDHQLLMCAELDARGLIVLVRRHETLNEEHLARAAAARVVPC
jgi:UDP-N-acetylglucosamine transferase subunit ALG13